MSHLTLAVTARAAALPRRRRRLLLVAAALAVALPTPGVAEEVPSPPIPRLTLVEAAERALATHPALGAARARDQAAQEAVALSEAARLPSAGLSASGTRFEQDMPVTPIHSLSPTSFPEFDATLIQGYLQVRQSVWEGGARRARIDVARASAEAAGSATREVAQQVVAATARGYLRVRTTAAQLEAHERRLASLVAERERAGQLLAAGRAAEVDVRRAEAAVAAADAERVRLESQLGVAEADLARELGADVEVTRFARLVPVRWAGAALPAAGDVAARAAAASPRVEEATRQVAAAEAALRLARSTRRGSLWTEANLQELGSSQGAFSEEWNVAVKFAVPLFDPTTASRVARAEAERDAAQENLRLVRLDLTAAADRAVAAAAEGEARAASFERAAVASAEVERIEKLRLAAGVGTQNDYLRAAADLLAARAGLAEARLAATSARIEVERLAGGLDIAWLADNLEQNP